MLAAILSTRCKVFKSFQNGNNDWYVRKYAKAIRAEHEAIVLEYGLRFPGDIKTLCGIIRPNIGIITNIGHAHIGEFEGDITHVAREKSQLIHALRDTGFLVINADDAHSKLLDTSQFEGEILNVSLRQLGTEKTIAGPQVMKGLN
jgi:UDP-N-acetylmuramoyl-tripeptide--D-alanyl-D-alanine ligase